MNKELKANEPKKDYWKECVTLMLVILASYGVYTLVALYQLAILTY